MDIKEAIKEIEDLRKQAKELRNQSDLLYKKSKEKIKELRKRIREGETTGDKIKDLVILRYALNNGVEEIYRSLEKRVKKHVGEFILMIHLSLGAHNIGVSKYIGLGILKGDSLIIIDNWKCEFPTENYVECSDIFRYKKFELEEKNLAPPWYRDLALDLNRPLEEINYFKPLIALEIKIGDEEVKKWFTENGLLSVFKKMAQLLNRPIDSESSDDFIHT